MQWNGTEGVVWASLKKCLYCRCDDKNNLNELCTHENTVSPNIFLMYLSFFKNVYGFSIFTLIQDKKKSSLTSKIVREFKKNIK